ncbi:transcription factor HIVEP3 isoform X2 [Takifugu rubripes]|uniref:transcription factor HIVEP3 isoform X2 n=1 Tax=Takifugu rubripes TaxID=31033 RepID=UPI001145FE96|nr:transcription factor HIVEP3-like isoform X2 [Takifugu rubripes]
MEAPQGCLTTGEQSGGQGRCPSESHPRGQSKPPPPPPHQQQQAGSSKPHGTLQQPKHSRRQHPERKRLRHQRQSIESDSLAEHKDEATNATEPSGFSPEGPPSSAGGPTQTTQEGTPKQKRERKPQRPGKYVCTYCGRACAKPSVLQKHIRSHTGERPYPCGPCGFSFKTKSNLYKHRKSHTHRVKAGLAVGEPRSLEEQATESEDETQQLSSALTNTEKQGVASLKSQEIDCSKNWTGGNGDSCAVKKRLALRLSRGKHGLQDSPDEKASLLTSGSKGSTESGYFSRSESTEQAQESPANTSVKSYAEIILGKYGRLGHLQRMPRQQNQQHQGQEDKVVPFTVPKKQVIDHITKLITINEAVVDTSKIDRVKPRRFSLSKKNSSESLKSLSMKGTLIQAPKAVDLGFKTSGSITMGVPCEKFHHSSLNVEKPADKTPSPLVRSHSMPSAQSSLDSSSCGSGKFRSSQSFDEKQTSERLSSRRYGMLKRQPAIEIPLSAELDPEGSHPFHPDCPTRVPDHKEGRERLYECETCGTGCKDWEGFQRHRQNLCQVPQPRNEVVISQMKCSQLTNQSARAGASALRKRRKEESFESDDPSSPGVFSGHHTDENDVAYGAPRRQTPHTCSVIQHTSSFEKQESLSSDNQATEASRSSPPHEETPLLHQKPPQQESSKTTRRLVRQHSVQVPEIFVTEDCGMSAGSSIEAPSTVKQSEKPDEFQWPQRSPSLSQLPIEKLPPKKKRLRLAEVAQSSGESSFDSVSLPRSPSQDSSASYASSRSTSFEESNRPDMEITTSPSVRKSRAPNMLTVPGVHQYKEMRRSASEQAPHDPQSSTILTETRSKSFDYSCLSPERSAVGWKERRKCLLIRHTAVMDPDDEEEERGRAPNHRSPERVSPSLPLPTGPFSELRCSPPPAASVTSEPLLPSTGGSQSNEIPSQWELGLHSTGSAHLSLKSVEPVQEQASHIHKGQAPPQTPQPHSSHGSSGAARAHYLPMSTGLKLEIPLPRDDYSEVRGCDSSVSPSAPRITSSQELLHPVVSPAVAVRLQTDTLTLACAIYTTLSQAAPRPREKGDDLLPRTALPAPDYKDLDSDLQCRSVDQRTSGSGSNKRMLSPSSSIEIHSESQQQQKRVKEGEDERREGCFDNASVETVNQEVKGQIQSRLASSCPSLPGVAPSFPSLLPSTCNSWCYLNYTKPNPSALDKQKPSVYSSWSTAGYDPNPPGLSSKTALALLNCKQRLSTSIYTTSPMSASTTESVEQEDKRREVYTSQSYSRAQDATREGLGAVGGQGRANQQKEEDKEEIQLISETRSNPDPSAAGAGASRCVSTTVPIGSAAEHLRLKVSGNEAPPGMCERPSEGGVEQKKSDGVDGENTSEGPHGSSQLGRPGPDRCAPQPAGGAAQKSSASVRRALFARRRLDASSSPGGSPSPSTAPATIQKPPRSPSPGPLRTSTPPSPLSSSTSRPVSPFPGLSPIVPALMPEPPVPPGPPGDAASRGGARLHGAGAASTRLCANEVGPAHIGPQRTRGPDNLLRHLPLHSQRPSRAPSVLIPIGGIHMIQPSSLLPLYTLVSSPSVNPPATSWRFSDAPKRRSPLRLQRQDSLRAASPGSRAASPDHAEPSPGK